MEQNKILLKTKTNKIFSLKTKKQISITDNITQTKISQQRFSFLYAKTSEIKTKN